MKRIFVAFLVALTFTTSSATFAATNPPTDNGQNLTPASEIVTFEQIKKSMLDVVVAKVKTANINIWLTDASGKILASKTLSENKTGTRVRFDLANLNDGVYYVRVNNGQNKQVKKFEIKTSVPVPIQEYYQEVTFI